MDAADVCDLCGSRPRVRVDHVDDSGDYGDVTVIEGHSPGCPYGEDGEEERCDLAGWEYAGSTLRLVGRDWPVLSARLNVGLCLGCGRLVVGAPLILFLDKGRGGELDFCFGCALELGVMDLAVKRRV
jgi:hypothetical protein